MTHYLDAAIEAARAAGQLLRHNFQQPLRINSAEAHDIKLEIDVRSQELITESLLKKFPEHVLYGEEGIVGDQTSVGVIYDPIREEIWTAQKGAEPTLNGKPFRVSERADLAEAVISVGLSKTGVTIDAGLPLLQQMVHRARKCRLMGSAALDMAYVACGRFDAYIEQGISLWDIAAGWILVETAGGTVEMKPRTDMKDKYSIVASNGVIDLKI